MNVCKERCVECDLATEFGFCSVTGCIKQNRVSNISIIPTVTVTDVPMVEYAPVVRCNKCKWWDKVDNIDGVNYGTCERPCTVIRQDAFLNENWFCKDGERRNDA